jgi:tyrosinase
MSDTAAATRYGRVKEILDAAAAGSAADYGIGGPPWRLPLRRLLEVEVYGVRMIAPPPPAGAAAGCGCGCATAGQSPRGDAPEDRLPRHPGRGAASGLVRGLRGQAPYDGSVFPRLPWGGALVDEDDVRFISDWIDDGCPADDVETVLAVDAEPAGGGTATFDPATVEPVVRLAQGGEGEYRRAPGEPRQRVNLDFMTPGQLESLRHAFGELIRLNAWPADRRSYNNIALIHQDHCQHGWERFLPWHRIYLYEMEQALLDVEPGVILPYWDFTLPWYRPDCPGEGLRIPPSYQAFLTGPQLEWLTLQAVPALPADEAEKLEPLVGRHYTSLTFFLQAVLDAGVDEAFTRGEHRNRFIDALRAANPLWYSLRYPGQYYVKGKEVPLVRTPFAMHYPSAADIAEIMSLKSFRDFGGGSFYDVSFGFLDQNPHNTMHIWTGGMNPEWDRQGPPLQGRPETARNLGVRAAGRTPHTPQDQYGVQQYGDMLSNLTASYDPVFWPVHVNIDRLWHEWQGANPGANPADLDGVLTPWSYTLRDTLDIARFGYEYVKSAYLIPVGLATPVGRFVSKPIAVPDTLRAGFRSAEVRLHRVPQLDRSCFVRVFLNLPDADAATPVDHPSYAGYLAVFGHGECIGGPGHCAVPERRPFDLRPRSHNEPRNHRVNVTRAARALLEAGATRLQVTLVCIGVDYCRDDEVLRLEGVSLTFLD